MNLNDIQKRAEDITDHDGLVPYPGESAPMPDGTKVGHLHAPAPPRIPHAAKPPSAIAGLGAANHRGQMAAVRAGQKGVVFDGYEYDGGDGMASPYPTGAQTAGAPMYPWMSSYQGNFTAPMSGAQNQGLSAAQNYVGNNPMSSAQSYNDQLLNGGFMGSADPYLTQIRQGMQGTKSQQDADARQQIASAMSAGGNALSGARLAAEGRYQNQSDNNFNTTMGNLEYGNLAREEALRNQGVGQSIGLNNASMGNYENLMGMGAVPQQLEQHDLNSQYADWVRQIGAMQQGDQQNMSNAQALLRTNPGGHNPNYGTSQASGVAALLSGLFGNGGGNGILGGLFGNGQDGQGGGGGLGGLLNSLFGGGGGRNGSGNYPTPDSGYPDMSGGGGSYWANNYDPTMSQDSNMDYGDFSSLWDSYFGGGDYGGDQYGQYDPWGLDPSSYT
jgi:hypothetical protein